MDPFSALGAAAAIAQFVQISFHLISGACEIYKSTSGMPEQDEQLGFIMTALSNFSSEVKKCDRLGKVTERCEDLSSKLLRILERTKAKDPQSMRQSAIAALKSRWNEREKQELKDQVNECRDLLHFQLTWIMRSDMVTKLQEIAKKGNENSIDLASVQRQITSLEQGVRLASLGPEAEAQMANLFKLSEEALQTIMSHRILNAITFPGIHKRFSEVTQADSDTFKWIFENPPPPRHQKALEGRMQFTEWLRSGNGIFHIAAKPGAGKSTLMKFIAQNTRTKDLISDWANGRKLVIGKFFFWLLGSEMQNSIHALLRTLIFDVLEQCPDLVPCVFPRQWSRLEKLPRQAPVSLYFDNDELLEAFDRLLKNHNHNMKRCFCFFIDGLDELHQTDNVTYKFLAKLLSKWIQSAPNGLKLCVSSREDNEFLDNFSSFTGLKLQDLTYDDMFILVRKRLEDNKNFREMQKDIDSEIFFSQIVSRADGVFLWVILVVNLLDDTCDNEYDFSELQRRLEWTHPKMEKLIQQLLSSIDESEKSLSAQTFEMILDPRFKEDKNYISLFRYSFLDDYNKDPKFTTKITLEEENCLVLKRAANLERCIRVTRKRLYARCKGLLEVKSKDDCLFVNGRSSLYISYCHRAIQEFLLRKDIQQDISARLDGFNTADALLQTFVSEIALISPVKDRKIFVQVYVNEIYHILRLVAQREADYDKAIETLRHIDRIMRRSSYQDIGFYWKIKPSGFSRFMSRNATSISHFAAMFGISDYFTLELQPKIHDDFIRNGSLLLATMWSATLPNFSSALRSSHPEFSKIMQWIFQNGGNPNQIMEKYPDRLTFWHLFLRSELVGNRFQTINGCKTLEIFLEFGVDPHTSLSMERGENVELQIHDKLTPPFGKTPLCVIFQPSVIREDDPVVKFIESKEGEASLREILEFLQPPNIKNLLALIDEKSKPDTSVRNETTRFGYQSSPWMGWWKRITSNVMLIASLGILLGLIGALIVSRL